jgi:hypothetical protein
MNKSISENKILHTVDRFSNSRRQLINNILKGTPYFIEPATADHLIFGHMNELYSAVWKYTFEGVE